MIIENPRANLRTIWEVSEISNRKNKDTYLPYKTYLKYVRSINAAIEAILMQGKTISLPHRMGSFRLRKFMPNKRFPDWKMTKKLWKFDEKAGQEKKIIYLTNAHTSGYGVKFVWHSYNCQFQHKSMLCCKRTRGFQRRSAVILKQVSNLIDKIKI